ncbi:MAG TPA: hypothetical protein VNE58_13380 [Casimicrobiaceae bacterium]|nr:hypothetical protein [Casimicrobiaceae bacterium]
MHVRERVIDADTIDQVMGDERLVPCRIDVRDSSEALGDQLGSGRILELLGENLPLSVADADIDDALFLQGAVGHFAKDLGVFREDAVLAAAREIIAERDRPSLQLGRQDLLRLAQEPPAQEAPDG